MLTFVIFHAAPAPGRPSPTPFPLHATSDYADLIDLAFRSATLFHPRCRRVLLTDAATPFAALPASVEIVRRELDPAQLMYERTASQLDFLRRCHDARSHLLMMDADMLVRAPLGGLFGRGMHLGLTYRAKPEMPLNGGLIAVSRRGREAAQRLLERLLSIMAHRFPDELGWYGDQRALIELIGHTRFQRRSKDALEIEGIGRVVLWPCDTHNYAPPDADSSIHAQDLSCRIVHFKGPRKRLMRRYWDLHLAELEISAGRGGWWRRWLGHVHPAADA